MDIQLIRKASQDTRLEEMIRELCGAEAVDRPITILEVQMGLRALKKYRLSNSANGVTLEIPSEKIHISRKVVIAEQTSGKITETTLDIATGATLPGINRENSEDPKHANAYAFLSDYLGLGLEKPLSISEIHEKYPSLTHFHVSSDDATTEYPWYDTITKTILRVLKREMSLVDTNTSVPHD